MEASVKPGGAFSRPSTDRAQGQAVPLTLDLQFGRCHDLAKRDYDFSSRGLCLN
jgi:hypothetical protein